MTIRHPTQKQYRECCEGAPIKEEWIGAFCGQTRTRHNHQRQIKNTIDVDDDDIDDIDNVDSDALGSAVF